VQKIIERVYNLAMKETEKPVANLPHKKKREGVFFLTPFNY